MQVWRQRNPEFVRILNDIRTGNGKGAIQELLQQCSRPLPEQNGVKPTQLFSRNADVDTVNAEELRALQGEEVCPDACSNIGIWNPGQSRPSELEIIALKLFAGL